MKKFLVGVLTCLTALTGVVCFTACSKNKQQNLANLKTEYETLADDCVSTSMSGGKIVIDYSVYKQDNNSYFQNVINTTAPYTRLNDFYNPLFQNSMSFAYKYIDVCSSKNIRVSESTKENLDNNLKALKSAIKNVDDHVGSLAKNVAFADEANYTSIICSTSYRALFDSYDSLLSAALKFNFDLANIYFNYGLTSAVEDYSQQTVETFDAGKAVINLKSQTDYQIINLTRAYYSTYVKGNALTTVFTTKNAADSFPTPDSNYTNYLTTVSSVSLNDAFVSSLATKTDIINQDAELKKSFYEKRVAMSNVQRIMKNDFEIYEQALNDIVYLNKKSDPNATDYEQFCVKMVESHNYIVGKYNDILVDIIQTINNAGV